MRDPSWIGGPDWDPPSNNTRPKREKQHDAHVKARRALARRIVNRRLEWGVGDSLRKLAGTAHPGPEELMPFAYAALALYSTPRADTGRSCWGKDWGAVYSKYQTFGGPQTIVGQTKDVPADVVHSIMCRMED